MSRLHLLPALVGAIFSLASAAAAAQTGVTGAGAPIGNLQPSLVMTQSIAFQGIFPCRDCPGSGAVNTIGMIHTFAGDFTAFGMPSAQGQIVPIATHTALFSILENNYGGDGKSTFALPDLTGRTAVGVGGAYSLGQAVGDATNIMSLAQLPAHDHGLPGGGSTGVTGGATPLNNVQPSLGLNYEIAVSGAPGGTSADPFLGEVSLFAGGFDPGGFMRADGRILSIADFTDLFSVIGTTYGGDGVTTFALPNLTSRTAVGVGNGVSLGEAFGSDSVALTDANLAPHDHTLAGGGVTDMEGGGAPFDNAQPSLGLNYLVALQGIFPTREGTASAPDFQYLGEVVAYAGDTAPRGSAFAEGQLIPIASNTALFSILGTMYGGDGKSTFALPDLRGRTILGSGDGFNVGDVLGERLTTLTVDQLAPHAHDLPAGGVPEPASWALMIIGFGLSGAALRRRARARPA